MENTYLKNFTRYTLANIIGSMGLSIYIFADTFFISYYTGPLGLAALNISIPIYSLLYGIGNMIGVGGGTNFSYSIAQNKVQRGNNYFTASMFYALIIGMFFTILGIFFSRQISSLLGANLESIQMTNTYIRTILIASPFFILSAVLSTFIKYDNNPNLAMWSLLISSFFNIVGDYVLMEYFNMGIFGAALATCLSPVLAIFICLIHFSKNDTNLKFNKLIPRIKELIEIVKLGISTFVYEISGGIVVVVFNYLILGIAGNMGIAAYGIIANVSAIINSMFNGLQQGMQPLISYAHGKKDTMGKSAYYKYGLNFSIFLSIFIYFGAVLNSDFLISIFNSQNVETLYLLAKGGIVIYFLGFLPHGINISIIANKNAINEPRIAFFLSIARGTVFTLLFAVVLSHFFGMRGIWLSFPLAEITTIILYKIMNKAIDSNL